MNNNIKDSILVLSLICTLRLDHAHYYIATLSEESLYRAFCELQANIGSNSLSKEKCSFIIDKISDQDLLTDIILTTKNFPIINEAFQKINNYSNLKKIALIRPELEIHVRGRLQFVNSFERFIFD